MEYTEIEQNAYAINIDSETVEYRLETSVLSPGALPTTAIFVYTVNKADAPASDTFSRVASVADLDQLSVGRDAALAAGGTEYLRSGNQLQYTDINIAKQAKEMFTSRINDLINTWTTYRDSFQEYNGQIRYFPTVDPNYEAQLKQNYVDARTARLALEVEVSDQQNVVDAAKTSVNSAQSLIDIYQYECDFCALTLKDHFPAYVALVIEDTTATTFRTTILEPEFDGFYTHAKAMLASSKNSKTAAEQTVATESANLSDLQGQLKEAKAVEEAALAAVRKVCPDFSSSSV